MAEIKKKFKPLSEWLEYELETKLLDPPKIRLRLAPIFGFSAMEQAFLGTTLLPITKAIAEAVVDAVKDWDITEEGKPLPLDDVTKRGVLLPLFSEKIKGRKDILGVELFNYGANEENFLKNLPTTSA